MRTRARALGTRTTLVLGLSLAAFGLAVPAATAGEATVAIDAPVAPAAGPVDLTGRVGVASDEVTTVLYAFDATNSTAVPTGSDCSGDGAVGPEDDLNLDGSTGDILDCEIAGVVALNHSLAATTQLQVGLVAFADSAAAADVDPAGPATFVPPGFTGGDAQPRIETVAKSVVRSQIGLYDPKDLGGSGSGTAFNSAVDVALATLRTAPAGPKWIMFLSDGQSAIDDGLLGQLTSSGVRLRSFGIGADATCAPSSSLYKMAAATGESCTLSTRPTELAAELAGSTPDAVNGLTVTIDGVSVAADLNAVGGWRAGFTLGAGTYTATARAVLASGSAASSQRTFTVASKAGGPPPGTVTPGSSSLQATGVKVTRPAPSRAALPSKVTGRVGRLSPKLTATPKLAGAKVLLQARPAAGAPWVTVDRAKANRAGKFALAWKPKARLRLLRIALQPHQGFAASVSAVPTAKISACKVTKGGGTGWSVTCRTTAKTGSKVRLLAAGKAVAQTRVKRGTFRLTGTGRVTSKVIDITVSARSHIRLAL